MLHYNAQSSSEILIEESKQKRNQEIKPLTPINMRKPKKARTLESQILHIETLQIHRTKEREITDIK